MIFFKKWNMDFKRHSLLKIFSGLIFSLPTPINISNWWNFGRFLGLLLVLQLISGLILASHFISSSDLAFESVDHIIRNVSFGWLIRILHLNGARFFFIGLYIHIGRGLYYSSYKSFETWNIGVIIFIFRMLIAFIGYVLPWGQIRFWGATVITNLVSAIPWIGSKLVIWIWGGYSIGGPTLSRFFILHFCCPFILIGLIGLHLFFLHIRGRNNPLSFESTSNLILFAPFFWWKDVLFFCGGFLFLEGFVFFAPFFLGDPENFILANPLVTPTHIVPEWYFLFAYAILRAIPNKGGGVIFLGISVLILFFPSIKRFFYKHKRYKLSKTFCPKRQFLFFLFLGRFFLLTWLGGQVVESPFIELRQFFLLVYFGIFIFI